MSNQPDPEISRFVDQIDRLGLFDALSAVRKVIEAAPVKWFSDVGVQSAALNLSRAIEHKLEEVDQ